METLQTIFNRRSIRKFTKDSISKEHEEMLIRAGMYAPTANNRQPWHFIVINDRNKINEIAKVHPSSEVLNQTQLLIVLCGSKLIEETEAYIVEDCSAATQNILLAAHDLKLGSVWLGLYPRADRVAIIKNVLILPDEILPVAMIAIGHPAETKEQPERFLPERIHYNKF